MKKYTIPIASIVSRDMVPMGSAFALAFIDAGVKLKPTTDVFAFPQPMPPYEMYFSPEHNAFIVRQ